MALILLSFAIIIGIIALYIRNASREADYQYTANVYSLDRLLMEVQERLTEITKESIYEGLSDAELFQAIKVKENIKRALRNCVFGIDSDKRLVIDLIVSIIHQKIPHEDNLSSIIDFDNVDTLSTYYKWEVLLYYYSERLGYDLEAWNKLAEKYKLVEPRRYIEDGLNYSFIVTADDINAIYDEEQIQLSHEDKNNVIARIIFSKYKGFGCIDTIRAQNINGISIGNSGAIMTHLGFIEHKATASVWLNCNSQYVHLAFLDLYTEDEIRRIVTLAIRWQNPGPLTEKRGALVNTMYDKSRILAIRPPLSEYWGLFIRKFSRFAPTLEKILLSPNFRNKELPYLIITYVNRALLTAGYTGRQGSGKTTVMRAAVKAYDPRYNLRILEMAAELYIREMYPERNVMSFFETPWCPISVAQDAQKKSDGAITIFGEVATDAAAARLIQSCQVAALCCMFSHHGVTPADMIRGLSNSMANDQGVTNIATIEYQVVRAIPINIDLAVDTNGKRYVNHITEIIPTDDKEEYPEIDLNNLAYSMIKINREYYTRVTDRPTFVTRTLMAFDYEEDAYYTVNPPSMDLLNRMMSVIATEYKEDFRIFCKEAFFDNLECRSQIKFSDPLLSLIEGYEETKELFEEEEITNATN